MDYEEITLITIFTNLHHKINLLINIFSLFFSRSFTYLEPSCFPFFIRLLLLFFQKNQILSPDQFKPKVHSEFARKKRNHEEFIKSSEKQSKTEGQNQPNQPKLNSSIPRTSQKFVKSMQTRKTSKAPKQRIPHSPLFENIFCFIRKFMRNSSLELLNIYEVANQFLEKLSEINLHGKEPYFFFSNHYIW